jgi:hypothetical protein
MRRRAKASANAKSRLRRFAPNVNTIFLALVNLEVEGRALSRPQRRAEATEKINFAHRKAN